MRVTGYVQGQVVHILIDIGSTHNFIHERVAGRLNFVNTSITPFNTKVATGDNLKCMVRYDNVPITIQGFSFHTTLNALPIAGMDIVLGIQWLRGLGCETFDYATMTMEFESSGASYVLRAQTR